MERLSRLNELVRVLAIDIEPLGLPIRRERPTDVRNRVPALVVQSTGDPATTYEAATAMHRAMAGSRMLTLQGARIHAVYANYGNACVDGHVNAYLRDGVLPARNLTC